MPILLGLASLIVLAVVFGPQWWIRHVLARHGGERPDFPGTGAELARHLLDEAGLTQVKVERTDIGDHYDPLSPRRAAVAAASRWALGLGGGGGGARGVACAAACARRACLCAALRAGQQADLDRPHRQRHPAAGAGRVHRRQGADPARASAGRRLPAARDPHRRASLRRCRSSSTRASPRRCRCWSGAATSRRPTCRRRATCCAPPPGPMWRRRSPRCSTSRAGCGCSGDRWGAVARRRHGSKITLSSAASRKPAFATWMRACSFAQS